MACWECLLSPQCVFTEPNSFLGRNGASLSNMCTTHLLPYTHTHTHSHIHTHTENIHRPHQTTNQTSGIWGLAVARGALRQLGDTRKQRHQNTMLPLLWLEWTDQMKLKIQPGEESVCAVRGWMNARRVFAMNEHMMSWMVMRDMWQPKRFVNVCALLYWGRWVCERAQMKQIAQMIQFKCDFWWQLLPGQFQK